MWVIYEVCVFVSVGTYSIGKEQHCTVCPKSNYCPYTDKADEVECPEGTYSVGGKAVCDSCPSGWKCPSKDGTANAMCLPVSKTWEKNPVKMDEGLLEHMKEHVK